MALLTESAGAEVRKHYIQNLKDFDPAFFVGKGKAKQIAEDINSIGVDSVIFDDDLSPVQMKNLGKITGKKVIDRTGLIIEIFAQNARTREAKTQVELAQLQYLLPRLTRQWLHLERQVGSIGVMAGMGETQLEIDRRLVRRKIKQLKKELHNIDNQRDARNKKRLEFFKATLVGYTNAGKSTLFNALIPEQSKGVMVADRLFATLDSTIRRLDIDNHQVILLADTVGFIRKLPHNLIASFKSTFSVVGDADILLNIVDINHPRYEEHIEAVLGVLHEMDLDAKPVITVFNKIDLVKDDTIIRNIRKFYPDALFISAARGIGMKNILEDLSQVVMKDFFIKEITLPIQDSQRIAGIYDKYQVLEQTYKGNFTILKIRLSQEYAAQLESMITGT